MTARPEDRGADGRAQHAAQGSVRSTAFYLFVISLCVYLLTASALKFYHIDASRARYEVTKSLVERGAVSIPDGLGVKGRGNRDYSWYGIGVSLLGVPFYVIGDLVGTPRNSVATINQIAGASTVLLVFLFSHALGYSKRTSLLTALCYGFGTFAWAYTKHPFDHAAETCFVLASVFFIYLYSKGRRRSHLVLSALAAGMAFNIRYTSILVVPPLFVLLATAYHKDRGPGETARAVASDSLFFAAGLAPFMLLALWYDFVRFGSVFETGFGLLAARTGLPFFTGTPLLRGLAGLLVSPGKGYLWYSPAAVLFLFSVRRFSKRHPECAVCFLLLVVSYLAVLSKNIYWHGDWAWGPRYLLVLTPFLMIPAAEAFEAVRGTGRRYHAAAVGLLCAVSAAVQLLSVSVDPQKYFFDLTFEEGIDFTEAGGEGVPSIVEPPPYVYFQLSESPIIAQFRSAFTIGSQMRAYRYEGFRRDAPVRERIYSSPNMNLFDFWWLYALYLHNDRSGFIAVAALLALAVFAAARLRRLSGPGAQAECREAYRSD